MRLSAIDVKKQQFKKSFKGYDKGEVEAYLDTVANQLEMLFRENEELKQNITKLEQEKSEHLNEIQVYRDNEKTFQKAIVKSQDMSEEVLENAKKRAELIIKEAEILSSKTRVAAHEEFMNLRQELEDLRIKNETIIDDIKNYLVEKLNSVEEYSKNRKIFRIDENMTAVNQHANEKPEENTSIETPRDYGRDFNAEPNS